MILPPVLPSSRRSHKPADNFECGVTDVAAVAARDMHKSEIKETFTPSRPLNLFDFAKGGQQQKQKSLSDPKHTEGLICVESKLVQRTIHSCEKSALLTASKFGRHLCTCARSGSESTSKQVVTCLAFLRWRSHTNRGCRFLRVRSDRCSSSSRRGHKHEVKGSTDTISAS